MRDPGAPDNSLPDFSGKVVVFFLANAPHSIEHADFERYLDRIQVVTASSGEWPVVSVVPPESVAEFAAVAGPEEPEFEALAVGRFAAAGHGATT